MTAQGEHWNKEQYVGDHGDGAPAPQDPDTMPEGETSISGNRHTSGEEHWAPGEPADQTTDPRRAIAGVTDADPTVGRCETRLGDARLVPLTRCSSAVPHPGSGASACPAGPSVTPPSDAGRLRAGFPQRFTKSLGFSVPSPS